MRIVYCLDQIDSSGGVERVTVTKANALSEIAGNEVYVVVAFHRSNRLTLSERVHMIDLNVPYYKDIAQGKISQRVYMLKARNSHMKKIKEFLESVSPDIVISTGKSEKQFLAKLKISSNPVIIREMHFTKYYRSIDAVSLKGKLIAKVCEFFDYGLSIRRYDRIVVLTNEDKEENWKNNLKVVVIPNPISQNSSGKSQLSQKRVIAAGRLVIQKNFKSLASSWDKVAKKHPDWKLAIYGEGPLREALQKQIDENGLSDYISLMGYTNRITDCMINSSIYALSSTCEGFALVLLEAMNCGLPIVSYSCPCGPREIILDGNNGFLVPVNDEEMLAERICYLIENESERKRMGNIGYKMSQNYTIDRITKMWMALFRSLLKEKRGTDVCSN